LEVARTSRTLEDWWRAAESGPETSRLIARFLRHSYRQAAFLSSAELANSVGVSQASISRFAITLGFSGYGAWVKALQSVIRLELSASDRLWFVAHPVADEDGDTHDRVLMQETQNLLALEEITRSVAFHQIVERIAESHQVAILSTRASGTLAPYLHYFLGKIKANVRLIDPCGPDWDRLLTEDPDLTLIFALVYPRYPRALVEYLSLLQDRHFHVLGLTDCGESPLFATAEIALTVPVAAASLFDSYAAPMVALNLIIRHVAQITPEDSGRRLKQIEELDQMRRVYMT